MMPDRVLSVTGSPNFEAFVAVDMMSIDPDPTTGLILKPTDGGEYPAQVVLRS